MSHPQDFNRALDEHIQFGQPSPFTSTRLATCPLCGGRFDPSMEGCEEHREECWADQAREDIKKALRCLPNDQAQVDVAVARGHLMNALRRFER